MIEPSHAISHQESTERAWVEVNPSALRGNLAVVRAAVGTHVRIIPMVKANAYGLGLARAIRELDCDDVFGWGVATVPEGCALRKLGVSKPVFVLGPSPQGAFLRGVEADLTLTVSSLGAFRALVASVAKAGRSASFQVEIDTGMGRTGFSDQTAATWAPRFLAEQSSALRWVGCFTHFHNADGEGGPGVAAQRGRFAEALSFLGELPPDFLLHDSNSAGALRITDTEMNAVRPGIFLYGGGVGPDLPVPEPVVCVRGRIVHIREVAPGATTGYGATYTARTDERWATVGIGYGDGLPRILSNRGHGIVRGVRVPVRGRISMDMTVVDITGLANVSLGDPVTFVGADQGVVILLDDVAALAGTISYEILTGLGGRLPRVWLGAEVGLSQADQLQNGEGP